AARAVEVVGAVLIILGPLEHGQHVVPGPATQPLRGPVVIVATLPAHIDHGVDRRAAAEHLAARIADATAVQSAIRFRLEAPVRARIADGVEIAYRHVDPEVIVLAAGFDQQHADARIGRQTIREHTARGAAADDDVVEFLHRDGILAANAVEAV